MHQHDPRHKSCKPPATEISLPPADIGCDVIPRSVRLERVHPNRERSISEAIDNPERDPFDRIGLAAERVVGSVLGRQVSMDPRRILSWSTRFQGRHTIELDGVARDAVFLEYKLTFVPERASLHCKRQLLRAREVYLAGASPLPCRGVGVVVDCSSLVDLPPPIPVSTLESVVESIRNGVEECSVTVVPFEQVADYFRRSRYGALLSPDCLRAAYKRRCRSD
jgi:hypothetical protein